MVEGRDDENVVKNICAQHKLGEIETIHPYEGKDALLEAIDVRLKESDVSALGIIVDADADVHARWQSISNRLTNAGYVHVPPNPLAEGTIVTPPTGSLLPKVGIWLMPDNQTSGILEDFIRLLIPEDGLLDHARESLDGIPVGQIRFPDTLKPKALVHTWLAWQEQPGRPFGVSIAAGYLDHNAPAATTFAGWLQRTFFL